MAANVETMMYVREKPWHGLGVEVTEAPASADALRFAGLDWNVRQEPVYNARGGIIPGYKSNVRDTDGSVLGIVGDRYKVVQNVDAFHFTDDLIGGEVRYETAGSLREGRQVWLLAKMPERKIAGDAAEPYLCFRGCIHRRSAPLWRVFYRHTSLLFLAIHPVWRRQSASSGGKIPRQPGTSRL